MKAADEIKIVQWDNGQYHVTQGVLALTQTDLEWKQFNDCYVKHEDYSELVSEKDIRFTNLFIALDEFKKDKKQLEIIYPELGEKTDATIEYTCSHNGGFYVTTDLSLSGRGIKMRGDGSTHARGKKTYHMTEFAFSKIKKQYSNCYIALL